MSAELFPWEPPLGQQPEPRLDLETDPTLEDYSMDALRQLLNDGGLTEEEIDHIKWVLRERETDDQYGISSERPFDPDADLPDPFNR